MVKFDSLLDGGSALCAPMVHGSFVLWFASGSCAPVPRVCPLMPATLWRAV